MAKHSVMRFIRIHKQTVDTQRAGQRFCNMYIKAGWPELFYEDEAKALVMIRQWLDDHQYTETLPSLIQN